MKILLMVLALGLSTMLSAESNPVNYNHINLSASAQGQVDNDTITARLFKEAEGSKARTLADTVNEAISWGVTEAKKNERFKVQTRGYSTNPVYQKNSNSVRSWRVRQEMSIESQDMAAVSEALGQLQDRLSLAGLQYTISASKRAEAENALISEALAAFRSRAKIIAGDLGFADYRIVNINVHSSGGPVHYAASPRMEMAMSSKMAAPTIEAGEQSIQVNVSGTIELQK